MEQVLIGAKVNRSLAVTGRREGMHTLDMRVCSVSLYDKVSVLPGEGDRFVFGAVPEGFERERFLPHLNEVYEKLRARFGGDLRFLIQKGIPSGAGLGGSSAAAAGMARLFAAARGETPDARFLLTLGSDVPYMYTGGDARVTGTGECVEKLPHIPRKVLIVLPRGRVDTAAAYALYDEMEARGELRGRKGEFFNDLFAPAVRLCPEVGRAAEALSGCGAEGVVMTGSGSAVCAFFAETESAARAAERVKGKFGCLLLDTLP